MSGLEKYFHREKRKRVFLLIVILLIIFFFALNYGFPFLINSVIFIKNFQFSKNNQVDKKNENNLYFLEIDELPSATNSSSILISGTAFNIAKLAFYLNNKKVLEKQLAINESFTQAIENLKEEENNEIFVKGLNKENKVVKESKKYLVFFKKTKPKLEISEPEDNKKVNQSTVFVKGKTDKETVIKINDKPVVVDALGEFEDEITLNEGENKIKIQAQDMAGNQEEKTLTIIYQKEE